MDRFLQRLISQEEDMDQYFHLFPSPKKIIEDAKSYPFGIKLQIKNYKSIDSLIISQYFEYIKYLAIKKFPEMSSEENSSKYHSFRAYPNLYIDGLIFLIIGKNKTDDFDIFREAFKIQMPPEEISSCVITPTKVVQRYYEVIKTQEEKIKLQKEEAIDKNINSSYKLNKL